MSCHKGLNLIYFINHYFPLQCTNLGLNVVPIEGEQYLFRIQFFQLKTDCFLSFRVFLMKLKLRTKFLCNHEKSTRRIFHMLAQYLFTINERMLQVWS